MLAGDRVKKIISGEMIFGFIKVILTEIGNVGISHIPAYAVEIYVETEAGDKHIDVLSWEPV